MPTLDPKNNSGAYHYDPQFIKELNPYRKK